MLLQRKVVDRKTVAASVVGRSLPEVILVDQRCTFGDAIVQSPIELRAVHVIVCEIFFFVAGSRYTADTRECSRIVVAVDVQSVPGGVVGSALVYRCSVVNVGIISGKPVEAGHVRCVELECKLIIECFCIPDSEVTQCMWCSFGFIEVVHAYFRLNAKPLVLKRVFGAHHKYTVKSNRSV